MDDLHILINMCSSIQLNPLAINLELSFENDLVKIFAEEDHFCFVIAVISIFGPPILGYDMQHVDYLW